MNKELFTKEEARMYEYLSKKDHITIFLSHPMTGLKPSSVIKQRELAAKKVVCYMQQRFNIESSRIKFVDNYLQGDTPCITEEDMNKINPNNEGILKLGQSIKYLAECDYVYKFGNDRKNSKGCKIEDLIFETYNITVLDYEEIEQYWDFFGEYFTEDILKESSNNDAKKDVIYKTYILPGAVNRNKRMYSADAIKKAIDDFNKRNKSEKENREAASSDDIIIHLALVEVLDK